MQKILLTLPTDLLVDIDKIVEENHINRSELIRDMLKQQIMIEKEKQLHVLMAEGYQKMWKENKADAEAYLTAAQFLGEE